MMIFFPANSRNKLTDTSSKVDTFKVYKTDSSRLLIYGYNWFLSKKFLTLWAS